LWGISILRRRDLSGMRQALLAGAGAAALIAVAFLLSSSPLFGARTIEVRGSDRFSERQVLRMAGVGPGTNVVWLSTGGVAARLEANPWISSATVEKELPSTLTITVHDLAPVLARRSATGFELLAGDGSVLATAASPRGLPIFSGPSAEQLPATAAALRAMSPWLRSDISSAGVARSGQLTFHLGSAGVVTYGPATEASAKAAALGGIVRWAESHHVTLGSIDVSAPAAPVARPAEAAQLTPPVPCHAGQQAQANCA
jgi:cell division protein FtsQ